MPDKYEAAKLADFDEFESEVTYETLIAKVEFVKYGCSKGSHRADLFKDMYRYLRRSDTKVITRQTIRHWSNVNGAPKRNKALIFIRSYLISNPVIPLDSAVNQDKEVAHLELAARRKVHSRLLNFLKSNIVEESFADEIQEDGVQGTTIFPRGFNRVHINTPTKVSAISRIPENITGLFLMYRTRFRRQNNDPNYIAQEVVHIYKTDRGCLFRQWYQHEGKELARFDGAAAVIGDSVWLFGASRRDDNRMRVLKFRYIDSDHPNYRRFRWGIMLTDLPVPTAPDSVACRVFLIKHDINVRGGAISGEAARTLVKHLRDDDLDQSIRNLVRRTINNNVTASSQANSIDPQVSLEGFRMVDSDLRVDQRTIDNYF